MCDDLQYWESCEICFKNKAQIETECVVVESVIVKARGTSREDIDIQELERWGRLSNIISVERLCFVCYLDTYGSTALGNLATGTWRDEPTEFSRLDWPSEAAAVWEQERCEARDELRRRQLNWMMRDIDMFENQSRTLQTNTSQQQN